MRVLLLLLLLAGMGTAQAQVDLRRTDSLAMELVERHKRLNTIKMCGNGYRVQLYFGSDRTKAADLRNSFMTDFPGMGAYLIYQQPNFKVRVGDFRTRLEAQGFLKKIEGRYEMSFIVPDEIRLLNF